MSKTECGSSQVSSEHWKYNSSESHVLCIFLEFFFLTLQYCVGFANALHECSVTQSCPALCDPMDCSSPGSSVRGDSPGKNTGVGCGALLQGNLPNPGVKPRFPILQAASLLAEPQGKSKLASLQLNNH